MYIGLGSMTISLSLVNTHTVVRTLLNGRKIISDSCFFTGDDLNINFESCFYVAFEEDSSVCSQRASDSDLSRSDRFSFLVVAGFGGDESP